MGKATDPGPVPTVRLALHRLAGDDGFTDATNADITRETGRRPNVQGKSTQVSYALRTLREGGEIRVEYTPGRTGRRIHLVPETAQVTAT